MASLTLKTLLSPKSGALPAIAALVGEMGGDIGVTDLSGKQLLGGTSDGPCRLPVLCEDAAIGWVTGAAARAAAVAALLNHLAAKEIERRALSTEVLHLYREVHLIEQLSEQLTALLDFSAVGQSALEQARRLIHASHGSVLLMENAEGGLRSIAAFGEGAYVDPSSRFAASVLERGIAEIVNDCAADPRAVELGSTVSALLCAPLRAKQRTVGLIALADSTGAAYAAGDLKLLNTIALQTAAAIENSLLCAEMVDAVRDREQLTALQKELDTARTIQHSLVPRTFPPFPDRTDFEIHAQMTSAKAVGGDFFDFFLVDSERLAVVIGDVSGKGIPAALYMAVARTQIKTTALLQGMPPEECLRDVNRVLVHEGVKAMFATCFYGLLNTRTGDLHYCNAGHNLPWLVRASGELESVSETGGIPLGLFDRLPYTGSHLQLSPGDALFLYTDGVSEATNHDLDDFTDERLAASLGGAASLACREIIDRVSSDLGAFTAGAPQSDDITMLAIRTKQHVAAPG
jgi:serine phosphatase RsbU (regulator of sigma subunit)